MNRYIVLFGTASVVLASGCTTNIRNQDHTIVPSKVAFSEFGSYWIKPLGQAQGIRVHPKLSTRIQERLSTCMREVLPGLEAYDGARIADAPRPLVIEPQIVQIKKVSVAKRIFLGFFPGSSAVLMPDCVVEVRTENSKSVFLPSITLSRIPSPSLSAQPAASSRSSALSRSCL